MIRGLKKMTSNFGMPVGKKLRFLAIADFGENNSETHATAAAMDEYARVAGKPDFILGLGDNFYPYGVIDANDRLFKTVWRDVFLKYESLRVPWRMILGNHDYMGVPQAQIDYHYHSNNTAHGGYWYMPDNNYNFQYTIGNYDRAEDINEENNPTALAHFFALDSNGCQGHVQHAYPHIMRDLQKNIRELNRELGKSTADWKIVFAHHPMYTKGKGHGIPGRCLRDKVYSADPLMKHGTKSNGFNLEEVLVNQKVDAYFAGHEHVFQCHHAHNIYHVCCGASGADPRPFSNGFYQGVNPHQAIDYTGNWDHCGFVATELSVNTMKIQFIDQKNRVLHEVIHSKDNTSQTRNDKENSVEDQSRSEKHSTKCEIV